MIRKFHLDLSTLFFFLLSFCCGYFKQTILTFAIVLWHELGHILAIKICKYRFLRVELYPFGGITKIEKPINSSINKEIIISLSGVGMQFLLFFVNFVLLKKNMYLLSTYEFIKTANTYILLFNLLPIIPLDGSRTIHSLLEKYLSYEKSYFWYEVISICSLFLFCIGNIIFSFDNYFICGVLITQFFILKKQKKYFIQRFYLERYLREYPYKRIENNSSKNIHVLKKETLHFFKEENKFIHEKTLLQKYFSEFH